MAREDAFAESLAEKQGLLKYFVVQTVNTVTGFFSGSGQIFSPSKCLSEVIWIIWGYSFPVKALKNIYVSKMGLSDSGNSYKFKCYR